MSISCSVLLFHDIDADQNCQFSSAETGSVTVTANNLSDDNSWLTCLEGAPMTGIKCELNGMLSKKKAPIPVAITSGPAIGPF